MSHCFYGNAYNHLLLLLCYYDVKIVLFLKIESIEQGYESIIVRIFCNLLWNNMLQSIWQHINMSHILDTRT